MNRKRIFLVYCLLVLHAVLQAQGVLYFNGDVFQALQKAKKEDKLLIVECYAKWNYKSKWMNEMMNTSPEVLSFFEKNAVVCRVDTDTKEGAVFAQNYKVTDYPSIFVFNQKGTVINKIDNAMMPSDFIQTLEDDIFSLNGSNLWKMEQLEKFSEAGDKEKSDELFAEFLLKMGREELFKKMYRWIFENKTITYYNSTSFNFLVQNRKNFETTAEDSVAVEGLLYGAMHDYMMETLFADTSMVDTVELNKTGLFMKELLPQRKSLQVFLSVIKSKKMEDYSSYILYLDRLIYLLEEDEGPKLASTLSIIVDHGTVSQKAAARAILNYQISRCKNQSAVSSMQILVSKL